MDYRHQAALAMTRRFAVAISAAILLAACTVSPAAPASQAPTTTPTATAGTPRPTMPTAVPSPAALAEVVVQPDIQVFYTGDDATLWTSAFIAGGKTGPTGPLAIATATVAFGDGTAGSVSQDCTSPSMRLKLHHVYKTARTYQLAVVSATLCDPSWQLTLDSREDIRALAAASTVSSAWPACTTYQLGMTDGGTGAGLGNVGTLIRLTNVSNSGCNLMGYPGLQLVSAAGTLLPTHVRLATDGDYLFPAIAVGRVALGPGAAAAFQVGYTDNPSGSAVNEPYDVACPPARWVRVVLPKSHQFGTAAVPMAPCEGMLNVSPIFPGRDRIDFP